MKKKTQLLLSFFLFSFFFSIAPEEYSSVKALNFGKSPNHPERSWKVIESEHFLIHFYPPFEGLAQEMGRCAEEVFEKITTDLDARPPEKIPIIITQDQFLNGYAEPIKNRIVLDPFLSRSSVIGTRRFLTHELAHIITYEAFNTGFSLTKIYGVSNLPVWFLEGLAQYEAEYWYPSYDRMLRLNTLERTLLSPSERDAFTILGAHEGASGYNEGYAIVKYLFENYGHDKLAKLLKEVKVNNISLSLAMERIFGKTFLALESEWRQFLEETYQKQISERDKEGKKTETIVPFNDNEANIRPKVSPDGKIFTYLSSAGRESFINIRGKVIGLLPLRAKIRSGEKSAKEKIIAGGVVNYGWSTDSKMIAYTKISGDETGQPDFSLHFVKIKLIKDQLKSEKLFDHKFKLISEENGQTENLKLIESPVFSPDDQFLTFVANLKEKTNIYQIRIADLKNKKALVKAEKLTNTNDYLYKNLAWSPDGKTLAMTIYTPGHGGNIAVLEKEKMVIKQLTNDSLIYTNDDSSWSEEGKTIYFFSDRDGIANIYSYQTEEQKISKLTNSYQGFEFPFVYKNELYYTSYRAKGTDIKKTELQNLNSTFVEKAINKEIKEKVNDQQIAELASTNYFPWLKPDLIMPITGFDERGDQAGIQMSMDDLLQKHSLNLSLVYGFLSNKFSYGISYVNRMLDPFLGFQVSELPSIAATQDGESFYFQRISGFGMVVIRPFLNEISQETSNLGSFELFFNNLNPIADLTPPNAKGVRKGWNNYLAIGWSTQDISGGETADIHPKEGYRVNLRVENANRFLGSQFEYTQIRFDSRNYFPLWFDHVLAIHPVLEVSLGNTTPLLLGGPPINVNLGIQDFSPLRGFNIAQFIGDRLFMTGLEYRFPLFTRVNTVFSGLYLDSVYGALFVDIGDAWFSEKRNFKLNVGTGGELRFRIAAGSRNTLGAYLGLARKISEVGENQFYFGFANSF